MKKKVTFKKIIIYLVAAFLCTASIPITVRAEATELSATGKITTESLNVRSGPGKEYESIGKVYAADTVTITGEESGWYRIVYDKTQGYISSNYVTVEKDMAVTENAANSSEEATDEEEIDTGFSLEKYKLPLIIAAVIVMVLLIMLITVKGIHKLDDDEEDDDDEDEYEEEDDEDEYEEDDEEEEYYEPAPKRTVRKNNPPRQAPRGKEIDLILSNNPDDYRIDIDPIFFEDDKKKKNTTDNKKDADLERAMQKMEELQREIERIKNEK